MSDYERFEAAQGDPWSTDPVGDYPRQPREPDPGTYHDESQVLARMPHVGDEPSSDHHRQYSQSRSNHRRRRNPSSRPSVPAPVWVLIGMGLVVLIAAPFLMSNKSGNETALDGPGWEVEMPAPNADAAPTWSPGDTDSQGQRPGSWNQGASPTATVTAEPATPTAWGMTGEWVGAPPNAPYAHNAADMTYQAPGNRGTRDYGMETSPPYPSAAPIGQTPGGAWDPGAPSAVATSSSTPNYQHTAVPSQPAYPATASAPMGVWSDQVTAPADYPTLPFEATGPIPNANSWEQASPAPSLAAPQPENVMPGYGTYPTPQPNPYVTDPSNMAGGTPSNYPGARMPITPQQYPSVTPGYPAAGYTSVEPYPVPDYPRTAMSPRVVAPASSLSPGGTPAYPSQSLAPSNSYLPAATNPYNPQTAPTTPTIQPYYGSEVSTGTTQQSVARLNGTIQEPAARQAYDDRARPSYY